MSRARRGDARTGPAVRASVLGALAIVASLALVGCPLPQPLPESVAVDGGTVTPPRIVADSAVPPDTIVQVGTSAECPTGTDFAMTAKLVDDTTDEEIDARWFVDYRADSTGSHIQQSSSIYPPVPATTEREVPQFHFSPDGLVGDTHVVELVVSNGFYPIDEEPTDIAFPHRSPRSGYETQVYRWVFQTAAKGRCK